MKPKTLNPVFRRRALRGWTQNKLAERAALSKQTVSNVETGYYVPSLATLEKLSAALGVTVGTLITEYSNWETEREQTVIRD